MNKTLDTIKYSDREQWLEARRTGIGGSDVAAILGLSPWQSPLDVWLDKIGRAEATEESEAMYWGSMLEDMVAKEYARRTGHHVRRVNFILRDPDNPVLLANVDRLVHYSRAELPNYGGRIFTDRLLECKTASAYAVGDWGAEGSDEIPPYYLCQVMHYMGITGIKYADVAVLFGGRTFRIYTVQRRDDIVAAMRARLLAWWRDHVVADVAPAPRSIEEAMKLWPQSCGETRLASQDTEQAAVRLAAVRADIARLEARAAQLQDTITCEMADAEALTDPTGNVLCTWKSSRPRRTTSWKDVAAECNAADEVIARHTTETPGSRRFLLKVKPDTHQEEQAL